jgi:hypothetical protein
LPTVASCDPLPLPTGFQLGALTEEERDEFMALMRQRIAHGEEVLEAVEANVRVPRREILSGRCRRRTWNLVRRGVEAFNRRELLPDDFDRRLLEWRFGGAARH